MTATAPMQDGAREGMMTEKARQWIRDWLKMSDAIIGVEGMADYDLLRAIQTYRRTQWALGPMVDKELESGLPKELVTTVAREYEFIKGYKPFGMSVHDIDSTQSGKPHRKARQGKV